MRISDWISDVCSSDLLVGATGDDPVAAWKIVQDGLAAYGAGLEEKPQLLALNKGDLLDAELLEDIAAQIRGAGAGEIYSISGATRAGFPTPLDQVIPRLGEDGRTSEPDEGEEAAWSPMSQGLPLLSGTSPFSKPN